MSRIFLLFVVGSVFLLSGCLESDASEPVVEDNQRTLMLEGRVDSLQQRNEDLVEEARLKHAFLEEYITLINQTLTDLEAITQREGMVHEIHVEIESTETASAGVNSGTIEQRIRDNLTTIERYIEESQQSREAMKRQRAELNRIARARAVEVSSFEETIQKLNELIEAKEQNILFLRQEAEQMLAQIGELEEENTVLVEENTELREAYFVVGTRTELVQKGIIDRRGGFMSIGRKTRIEELHTGNFQAVTVETADIFIGEGIKKYQVLTNQQSNQALFDFEQRGEELYLVIADPEEFWKISRYLIIEIKK